LGRAAVLAIGGERHRRGQGVDEIERDREGRVTWYRTVSIPESKQFMDMFEKQYPLIKVDLLRSGSGEGLKKVFQDIENKNMSESIRLFQQTFGLSPG
jgi:hypothetical protein